MNLLAMFIIGLLGSGHCVGMCGGFAMTIGTVPLRVPGERPPILPALLRQMIYSGGRLFTYGFLGAVAGLLGARLARLDLPLVGGQQILAVVAGLLMVYIGLNTLGLLRFRWLQGGA
ncbi:MAG: sulfite exporter TauE/SafE family protein [Phycisphaerales bacterium]|nr:sulfite exporter TauE/SafE family protein [Phycisphaerales bacterium]